MDIKLLKKECDRLVREYAEKLGNPDVSVEENKKLITWKIYLKTINLEFSYTLKNSSLIPVSTLFCSVYLQKNAEVPYNLNQVIDYLDVEDFHCYTFSYIENTQRLASCFHTITKFIDEHYDAMNHLVVSDLDFSEIRFEEAKRVLEANTEKEEKSVKKTGYSVLYENQLIRYTDFPAYKCFLKGDYVRSLKQYNKLKKKNTLYRYEEKLVDFMEKLVENGEVYEAVNEDCASILKAEHYNGTSKTDAKAFILSVLLMYAAFFVPIMIIVLLLYRFYQNDTLFYDYAEPMIWSAIIAVIPSIFAGVSIVDNVKMKISKDKESVRDFDEIFNPPKTKKAAKILTVIMLIVSLFFGFMIAKPVTKCYDDYMLCDVSENIFTPDYVRYNYKDINHIYHINRIYIESTEKYIDADSYVFVFDDDEFLTYYYFETDDVEKKLLPQIEKVYNGEIRHIDSYEK